MKWQGEFFASWPDDVYPVLFHELGDDHFLDVAGFWQGVDESAIAAIQSIDNKGNGQDTIGYTLLESILGRIVASKKGGTLLFISDDELQRLKAGFQSMQGPCQLLGEKLHISAAKLTPCFDESCLSNNCVFVDNGSAEYGLRCFVDAVGDGMRQRLSDVFLVRGDTGKHEERKFNNFRFHLRNTASWIANMAVPDGAVVLTRRLRILGFAAKIAAPQEKGDPSKNKENMTDPCCEILTPRGTRHKSAVAWVAAGSTERSAIVVSQDGFVHGFFWKDNHVEGVPLVYEEI